METKLAGKPPPAATDMVIDQMPDTPQRGSHHRRAHSDTSFRFPNFEDLFLFDPSDLDLSALPSPTPSPSPSPSPAARGVPVPVDSSKSSDESSGPNPRARSKPSGSSGPISHFRSLSVDSDFFDGLGFSADAGKEAVGEKRPGHHGHSNSIDGFEAESALLGIDGVKKAMGPDRLAELALIDPKRAKRFGFFFFFCLRFNFSQLGHPLFPFSFLFFFVFLLRFFSF